MKYLKTFESYTFEDFTHSDMEDVKELLEEGLPAEQIAIELDFSLDKVKQIISSLENKNIESKIYIPIEYSGVIMELGEEVNPNDIISLYNKIVEEGTPLVSYSQYGTEGKFYNEDDDEIPTDVILDELNYAIGLEDLDETMEQVIGENDDDDFSEHQLKYREMNKYGINPHPKQLSGEWDYMHEYHKQILITLISDNKKRIDQLKKILETEENPNMVDIFQYEIDLTIKSNERLRDSLTSFDERNKK